MPLFNPDLVPRADLVRLTPAAPLLAARPAAVAARPPATRAAAATSTDTEPAADSDTSERPLLYGHFALFEEWTEIHSWWEGDFREQIAEGAFKKTIRESGPRGANTIQCLFDHGMDFFIGDKPLGPIGDLLEDDLGGYGEVPLSATSYNGDLEQLIADQALRGQSFRFSVVKDEWDKLDEDLPERIIREVKLFEFGPVTFPAYAATTVGVRSRADRARWQNLDDAQRARLQSTARAIATGARAAGQALSPATVFTQAVEALSEPPPVHSGAHHHLHMRARLRERGLARSEQR